MKIDRLIAITIFLMNRETVSASVLAKRFEVSKRTIQRDIDTLTQAGIPIVSTFGAEGGYAVMDGFKMMKQTAGIDDYVNYVIALKGLLSAYNHEKISATLEKSMAAMPPVEQKIYIDFSVARESGHTNVYLPLIEKAVNDKSLLRLQYVNAEGGSSERIVEPLALSFQWYAWYLFAFCTVKQDYRMFKLPRITNCEPVAGCFTKTHDHVEALMKKTISADKRKNLSIRLLCKKEVRQQVIEYLNGHIIEEHDNGDFIVAMTVPMERMWFSLLLGFGNRIEVMEPDELRSMVKQKAEEILSVYT